MAGRKLGKIKFSVLVRPAHPRFSCVSLNDAQRSAGKRRAIGRAYDAGETQFSGGIRICSLLRGKRSCYNRNQREQSGESSSQQLSRPFEPEENTVFPLP